MATDNKLPEWTPLPLSDVAPTPMPYLTAHGTLVVNGKEISIAELVEGLPTAEAENEPPLTPFEQAVDELLAGYNVSLSLGRVREEAKRLAEVHYAELTEKYAIIEIEEYLELLKKIRK